MKSGKIKTDCRFFPLDRPCSRHKKRGVKCRGCHSYEKVPAVAGRAKKILLIKLGAMGDVLRTTFLLEGLKEKYPSSRITWLVGARSADILRGNNLISEIIVADDRAPARLASERFAVAINLDLAPESLAFAALAQADAKIGFWLDGRRNIVCSGSYASQWLDMSAFDDVKKKNRKTYQWWMSKITGLSCADYEIRVPLLKDSVAKASAFGRKHGLADKKVVGINPGAGGRWRLKRWTASGYIALAKMLLDKGFAVVLYGGPDEAELIAKIKRAAPTSILSGTSNSVSDFFALLSFCDVLVTGDTLAMHAALGLGKKVVALFGPTSSAEIETYGRGKKITAPLKCVCCYITECRKKPNCMEMINPREVFAAVVAMSGLLSRREKKIK